MAAAKPIPSTSRGAVQFVLHERELSALADLYLPLPALYDLVTAEKTGAALDLIWHGVDQLLKIQGFDVIDDLLGRLDLAQLDVATTVGFLATTQPAQARLLKRNDFVERARQRFSVLLPPHETEALLAQFSR